MSISIYITDLSAYNQGYLVGRWISLPLASDQLVQALTEVLREGEILAGSTRCNKHEEVFITDYEADIHIKEYDDIDALNDLAEILETYSEDDLLKLKLLTAEGYNESEVINNGIDNYEVEIHDFRNKNSFTDTYELLAEELVDEGLFGEIPKPLQYYIDYEKIARDLRMDYCEFTDNVLGRVA